MRKILGALVGILVFLGGRQAVMAQEINLRPEDILATSSEREEISILKDEMIDGMLAWNGISEENETEYEEAKQYYTQNAEIHYEEAVKIHSSTYFSSWIRTTRRLYWIIWIRGSISGWCRSVWMGRNI